MFVAWAATGNVRAADAAAPGNGNDGNGLPLEAEREIRFETDRVTWLSLDVAPDGERFVLEVLGDLYTLPIAGGDAVPLTTGMAFDSQPAFSPDGTLVTFVSDRDGVEGVWVVNADGSDPRKITGSGDRLEFASPSFSPDGSHVVVSRSTWGLRTFELWAYAVAGGKGVQLTKAKAKASTPISQRHNALGANYAPDGRYLYYARKNGGFGYNLRFPQWQIARRDLVEGTEDVLTTAQGSAVRPVLSPDGQLLVYGTRYKQQTGLRLRNLVTGADRWLAYPVTHDDQESRFTRDLLPGYAFSPDGEAVFVPVDGRIRRISVADGASVEIPMRIEVAQALGPRLHFPYRIGVGPVKSRMIRDPDLSPDGTKLAFSAFTRIHVHDFETGDTTAVTRDGVAAFHPAWSADGRHLLYVTWDSSGGHVWRVRTNGRSPRQLTRTAGYYTDPVFSADGERIVALRSSSYERRKREFDFGAPVATELIWLPAGGGEPSSVRQARGLTSPHMGPDASRIYAYLTPGLFSSGTGGLVSMRYDGTDQQTIVRAKGPGIYSAEKPVPADAIRLSPDGRHALIQHANQLHVAALLSSHLRGLDVSIKSPSIPLAQLTDVGVDFFGWRGDTIFWTVGNSVYRRPLASVEFVAADDADAEDDDAETADEDDDNGVPHGVDASERVVADDGQTRAATDANDEAAQPDTIAEQHTSVTSEVIEVYRARYAPSGVVALVGATVLTMEAAAGASEPARMPPDGAVIDEATVVIEDDRILAVGEADTVDVPEGARIIDVSGDFIVPGYVDTHAHFRPSRRVLDLSNASFLANLAYGVTTGLDVQPATIDLLVYQDLVDAGLMTGPRVLSTGPGIFNNNDFESADHARAVLRRYREHYRVRNLKSYIAGSRKQRQWIAMAARELELMPTTEGSLDMKLDLTHVIDGFSGNEHNFPVVNLFEDTVQLVARSRLAYTPTLLVSYGGPWAETWFYTRENPHDDPKLNRYTPYDMIARRTLRTAWFHEDEYVFEALAEHAARIVRAGGQVGVGAHGQLQGLGYHWEMWALASGGMTPWETLRAATRQGAEIVGIDRDIGTVSGGKLADLLVLSANPLDDIRNTARIRHVVKGGIVYDAETLDQIWPEEKRLPDQWWWHEGP